MNESISLRSTLHGLWRSSRIQRLIAGILGFIVLLSVFVLPTRPFILYELFHLYVAVTLLELSFFGGSVRQAVATSLGAYLGLVILYLL